MKNALTLGTAIALLTVTIPCSTDDRTQGDSLPPVHHKTTGFNGILTKFEGDCERIAAAVSKKICHQPYITTESLKKATHLRDTASDWVGARGIITLDAGYNMIELPTYTMGPLVPYELPDGRILLLSIGSDERKDEGLDQEFDTSFIIDNNPESKLIEVDPVEALRLCIESSIRFPA